ncbi:MAG: 4-hydroxy-3-methylbut-2-enyl diphosphate reductase [Lentisphaeraceae bacterium]|nr:4-hydroxy-3-methylbut-2-enyl diphosphate reductase [Lentisphaeraceae bacterium]
MELLMSSPRGFCAGVDRAIEIVEEALELLPHPIYVNHEIVHNSHVIKRFQDKGVIFVESLSEVPDGSSLIFNAHGVPPALVNEAKERSMKVVDATCPLVSKVHFEAIRYAKKGFNIILIGHEGHPEVVGVMGESDKIHLLESPQGVADLPFSQDDKLAYITQTTLSIDDCSTVIKALKERYPQVVEPKKADICYATTNRQGAIKKIAIESDVVVVVGSPNSSNSNRLREVAENCGTKSYMVNCYKDLKKEWFTENTRVGITAGASTPEDVIVGVSNWLKENFTVSDQRDVVVVKEDEKFSLPKIGV